MVAEACSSPFVEEHASVSSLVQPNIPYPSRRALHKNLSIRSAERLREGVEELGCDHDTILGDFLLIRACQASTRIFPRESKNSCGGDHSTWFTRAPHLFALFLDKAHTRPVVVCGRTATAAGGREIDPRPRSQAHNVFITNDQGFPLDTLMREGQDLSQITPGPVFL